VPVISSTDALARKTVALARGVEALDPSFGPHSPD
jgi:hypothetical protein